LAQSLGYYTRPKVDDCLTVFLEKYAHYIDHFLKRAFLHDPEMICYFKSVVRNCAQSVEKWIPRCGKAKLLAISLYHQNSSESELRALAIELANVLTRSKVLDAEYFLSPFINLSEHVYLEVAKRYSQKLAKKYWDITIPLLLEFCQFIKPKTNEYGEVVIEYKRNLLTVRGFFFFFFFFF